MERPGDVLGGDYLWFGWFCVGGGLLIYFLSIFWLSGWVGSIKALWVVVEGDGKCQVISTNVAVA